MEDSGSAVTRLLAAMRSGDERAAGELMRVVYHDLRRMAAAQMRRERPGNTLQATALVHEAYLKLAGEHGDVQNRAHFFAIASRAMREVLINRARSKKTEKRGRGARQVDLDTGLVVHDDALEDVVAVDEALTRLRALDPRQEQIVELRFFGGLSVEETAAVLEIAPVTVKREWRSARAWLQRELTLAKSGNAQ